jgi:ABC-type dipeptide/oligopeptide/nickel transport system ATPase subunit
MAVDSFLSVRGLSKSFAGRPAIQNVTFSLERGHTLGVVGPSGAGKSTLARCLAFFETPTSGEIWLDGLQRVAMRADIQLIFQEPASSLNPRFTAAQIVTEPLLIRGIGTRKTRRQGLPCEYRLLANKALIHGEDSGREITATVFRSEPHSFERVVIRPRSVKAAGSRARLI